MVASFAKSCIPFRKLMKQIIDIPWFENYNKAYETNMSFLTKFHSCDWCECNIFYHVFVLQILEQLMTDNYTCKAVHLRCFREPWTRLSALVDSNK